MALDDKASPFQTLKQFFIITGYDIAY